MAYSTYLTMQCSEQMTGLGATLSYHRLRGWPRQVSFPLCACFLTWQMEVITTYFKELLWGVSPWVSVKRLAESLVHSRAEWVGASSLSWGVSWGLAIQRGEALLFAHGHGHFITFPHPAPPPPPLPTRTWQSPSCFLSLWIYWFWIFLKHRVI